MSGIKHIYRTADSFRLPTWTPLISYATNSIVAFLDSESGDYHHFIATTQTTAGSLDSDIRLDEWIRFSFDADTLLGYANQAVQNNFNALVASIDSDFASTLTQLDSDNDSDFRILQANLDSDLLAIRLHVDSELGLVYQAVQDNVDSDIAKQNAVIDSYIDQLNHGRVYDSEVAVVESVAQRLSAWSQLLPETYEDRVIAAFNDQTKSQSTITATIATDSVQGTDGLLNMQFGTHLAAADSDVETLTITFSEPAYVGVTSFRGTVTSAGGGYWQSANLDYTYEDGTSWPGEYKAYAAGNNVMPITYENPNPEKPITKMILTARHRAGADPTTAGINYLEISSVLSLPRLTAERLNVLHFASVSEMVKYSPHSDTVAIVDSVNMMFVNKDSDWVANDPRFTYVDRDFASLQLNFPATSLVIMLEASQHLMH